MKAEAIFLFVTGLFGHAAFAQEHQSLAPTAEAIAVSGAVAYQTAFARADVAIAKSILNESLLKGEVGEAIRDQTVGRYVHRSGQWLDVSPRLGPQGFDHVSVQLNENGVPHRLMVDETKFGASKLLTTRSGEMQMGDRWVAERLSGLAKRFDTIGLQARGNMASVRAPAGISSRRMIRVPLSNSESVVFWRPVTGAGPWSYDGPPESLAKATTQLHRLAQLLRAGADGRIDVPKRIFQVKISGDVLALNILDASRIDAFSGNLARLPVKANVEMPIERSSWMVDEIRAKLTAEVHRQMPYLDAAEAKRLGQSIQFSAATAEDALSPRPFSHFAAVEAAKSTAMGALVSVPIEVAVQLVDGSAVDWWRVAGVGGLAGASANAGNFVGNASTYGLVRTELGYSGSEAAAEVLGLRSASRFANAAGGLMGGGATAILFAYGGYVLGYYDLQMANRAALIGAAGVGAGVVAQAVALTLISGYATAGTGVSIATLSGVAATNASLAWVGGGTLVAGGWGVAGGTVILGTGVGVVIVGVAAATTYVFYLLDEAQDNIRLGKMIEYLSSKPSFIQPI